MATTGRLTYMLEGADNKPVAGNLFPFPTSTTNNSNRNRGREVSAPYAITNLCTLPPADFAQNAPPHLIDLNDGCSGRYSGPGRVSIKRTCRKSGDLAIDAQCVWDSLTRANALDSEPGRYCLPLDHPQLASRGIVPVPNIPNRGNLTELATLLETRPGSVLQHQLQLRNHSSANSPLFANVPVRPVHKRLRLGVCVPFPPTDSPCSPSAIDPKSGTLASDWLFSTSSFVLFTDERIDFSLAHPQDAFSSMVGPHLGNLDHQGGLATPPFPFLTYQASLQAGSSSGSSSSSTRRAWAIPLVQCAASNSSSTGGVVRPLTVDGPCANGRECLSGVCSPDTKSCDNSIKPETNSPFSSAFILHDPTRPVTFPSNTALRQAIEKFNTDSYDERLLPAPMTYYVPLMAAVGVALVILIAVAVWTDGGQRFVRKWMLGWRTTTERDLELKPVTGDMVADLGDERAVREAAEIGAEQLPVYASDDGPPATARTE
ncbi:hypothetical protein BCR44DRAFT_34342 [Catenaria anguillulae PL171]|uniref:Uncharacterized protein n=1 Tax=Catenaria anguillulae PL171 TaxID=765915 RepID=A0A1Y2HKX0_9FUNG|nr:hypothetical protein BCR44DRAFT_34342 [Catenaria anguillulae PL171]